MNTTRRSFADLGLFHDARKFALLAATLLFGAVIVFGDSYWRDGDPVHEAIEWFGLLLIVLCIFGRSWCTLYIGGRKSGRLVTEGPYSVSRNPLYLFSIMGAAGVGAQIGSIAMMLVAAGFAWLVFHLVALREERRLGRKFGAAYRRYARRVPRLLPRFKSWRTSETIEVRPAHVMRTFIDACVFLVAIPLAEGFEYLHGIGALPVLFRLP